MSGFFNEIADVLNPERVLWIAATFAVYALSVNLNNYLYKKIRLPKISSLYIASAAMIALVAAFGGDYEKYEADCGGLIAYMIYPATVALALPLYRYRKAILSNLPEVATAVAVSSAVSVGSIYTFSKLWGFDEILSNSLLSKCVTTPVAVEITKMLGALEGVAVCAVCITGICGAFAGHFFLDKLGFKNDFTIGLSIGATSHVIGTAKCLEKSPAQAAAGALVLILCALWTAVFVSIFFA